MEGRARLVVGLLLAATALPALCAGCLRVDYAEAKDWPAEQVEREYCAGLALMRETKRLALDAGPGAGPAVLRGSANCVDQLAMYERVLKNVHKRPPPPCQ